MTKKYVVGSSCVFLLSNNEKKVENLVTRKILFKMVSVSAESWLYKVVDSNPEVSSSTAHFYSEPHFCTAWPAPSSPWKQTDSSLILPKKNL